MESSGFVVDLLGLAGWLLPVVIVVYILWAIGRLVRMVERIERHLASIQRDSEL